MEIVEKNILIKGSRGMEMEEILKHIKYDENLFFLTLISFRIMQLQSSKQMGKL